MKGMYVCTSKKCPARGTEFFALLPSEARAATGGPVRCPSCGSTPVLKRVVLEKEERDATIA